MVTLIECRQSLLARLLHVMELMRLLWLEMPWRNELTLGWPPVATAAAAAATLHILVIRPLP